MAAPPLFPPSGVTIYSQLAGVLRGRIARGEWPIGDAIPTLDELCKEYDVARVSARQAIQMLVAEGLLSTRRGRRTLVIGAGLYARTLSTGVAAPLELVPEYSVTILSKDEHAELPSFANGLGKAERSYVRIRKVDREGTVPYAVSDIYVAKSVYRRIPRHAEEHAKLARLVRDASPAPLVSARERITVAAVNIEEARTLEIPLSSPVASVQRVFLDADMRIVYAGWSVYRGDRFLIERELFEMVHETSRTAPRVHTGRKLA